MGNEHFVNFIECMRSRKAEDLHAPIREGYLSTTLVHLANASYRLGRTIHFDPATETVIGRFGGDGDVEGYLRASVCGAGACVGKRSFRARLWPSNGKPFEGLCFQGLVIEFLRQKAGDYGH